MAGWEKVEENGEKEQIEEKIHTHIHQLDKGIKELGSKGGYRETQEPAKMICKRQF